MEFAYHNSHVMRYTQNKSQPFCCFMLVFYGSLIISTKRISWKLGKCLILSLFCRIIWSCLFLWFQRAVAMNSWIFMMYPFALPDRFVYRIIVFLSFSSTPDVSNQLGGCFKKSRKHFLYRCTWSILTGFSGVLIAHLFLCVFRSCELLYVYILPFPV